MLSRTGLPTTETFSPVKAPGKPNITFEAILNNSLLVMPAAAFCSCKTTGMPERKAAAPPGPEA